MPMALILLKKLLKPPPSSSFSSSPPSLLSFLASLPSSHLPRSPSSPPQPPPLPLVPTHTTGDNRSQPIPDLRVESIFCSLLYGSGGISYPCSSHSLEAEGNRGGDDDGSMWADSVKRKRKVKMNKHKYKKRRKLLRRKT